MFTYKKDEFKISIKSWIPEKDYYNDRAMVVQCENLAKLPFAFHHIALSPDGHVGYGMPIGGILATENAIVPNAVGVDIGCGMCAVKTSLTEIDVDTLKRIMGIIRQIVPVGFKHHRKAQDESLMPMFKRRQGGDEYFKNNLPIVNEEWESARRQIGTLGGGNHFIEIQKGDDQYIWIMIHSGSRNLGKKVADYYNKLAVLLNQKWNSQVPKEWELAFLPIDSEEGQAYLREMQYCVDFALANRSTMIYRIMDAFKRSVIKYDNQEKIGFDEIINIAHNYACLENHFGKNVWVHRKGSTLARRGTIGIIPGSQGTNSYIVEGKGNRDSFQSCSHGAGRIMGRKKAIESLSLSGEIKKLDNQGILHAIRGKQDLDEAPGSYKPIDEVMENQKDLVKIKVKLRPLAVIKG